MADETEGANTEESKKQLSAIQELIDARAKNVNLMKEERDLLLEQKKQLKDLNLMTGTLAGHMETQIEKQQAAIDLRNKELEIEQALLNSQDDLAKKEEIRRAIAKEGIQAVIDNLTAYTKEGTIQDGLIKQLEEKRNIAKETAKYDKEYRESMSQADGLMARLGKKSIFFSTNIHKIAQNWKVLSTKAGAKAFTDSLREQFSLSNLLVSSTLAIVEATAKLVMSADKATTSLAAATGVGRQFNDVLVQSQKTGNLFGLSMEESSKAIQGLMANTTNFVNLSKQQQTAMTTQIGLLSKLGVSASESADMINTLNLSMGMTMEEAVDATKAIAMMGTELGINSSKMVKDFKAAASTLAVYGPQATGVFKNLAAGAKTAGVEMSSLLSIAKKFDTFKDSANTVARLNALLGTQLSTTQMLMQTEDERIETLIKSVQQSGVAFKDMDRFQQKAVAAAAGITDMNEAQKIFGMNIGQFAEYQQQMDENELAQQRFNEAIDAATPIATKFISIMNELAIAVLPILEALHWALDGIKSILSELPEEMKTFLKVGVMLGGVVAIAVKFWGIVSSIAAALAPVGAFIAGVAGAITPVGWAVIAVGAAIAGVWALWDSGDKKANKLQQKLNKLETASMNTGASNVKSISQNNTGATRRASAGMTQSKVDYAGSTSTTNNIINNGQDRPRGKVQATIVVGDKEMNGYIVEKILE